MERWLVVALAGALWAGVGATRFTDYAAAQMPQYEAVNYDSQAPNEKNLETQENYQDHDQPSDGSVANDYSDYVPSKNDRTLKRLDAMDSLPDFNNQMKKTTTVITDYGDSDYNYKSEKISPRTRVSRKSSNNRNQIKMKLGRNDQLTGLDDEDTEIPSKQYEEEEESHSEHDRARFVRRDIRQKDKQQSWPQRNTGLSDPENYDRGSAHIKDILKRDPDYSEPEPPRHRPNAALPISRPHKPVANDLDESPSLETGKYRVPMPGFRRKTSEYVDYNDMGRIEKIKKLSALRSTVMSGASQSQRWSYRDSFRRRNFDMPLEHTDEVTTTPSVNASVAPSNKTTLPIQIAELSPEIIQNITAFINKSRHLSLAEKSQLSILKKAQRKDTAKDEMLKDKPPVLLQVTEKLQTVVMVEPPVSQEPWLRARDISEDSPERIEKVKRFMRNKLVATARNVSELMENWDDTICDYVDISLLEKSTAMCTYRFSSCRLMFHKLIICFIFYHFLTMTH